MLVNKVDQNAHITVFPAERHSLWAACHFHRSVFTPLSNYTLCLIEAQRCEQFVEVCCTVVLDLASNIAISEL